MVFIAQWSFILLPKRAFATGEADQLSCAVAKKCSASGLTRLSTGGQLSKTSLCLLKISVHRDTFGPCWSVVIASLVFFRSGSCSCNLRGWLTAKESHQPLQVLRRGRQVELFAHEAHPAQPESA